MEKFVETIVGKTPGFDLVMVIVSTYMLPLVMAKEQRERWAIVVVVGALAVSRFSAKWDDWLFDPVYGSDERITQRSKAWTFLRHPSTWAARIVFPVSWLVDRSPLAKQLAGRRTAAWEALKYRDGTVVFSRQAGIYKSAATIFNRTEHWDKHIRPYLEFSKASRVFLWPLIVAVVWGTLHFFTGRPSYIRVDAGIGLADEIVKSSQNPLLMFACLQGVAFLYLYLRITHVSKLYQLVRNATVYPLTVQQPAAQVGDVLPAIPMLCVDAVVVPLDALPIFTRRILCIGPQNELMEEKAQLLKKRLNILHLDVKTQKAKRLRTIGKLVRAGAFDVYIVRQSIFSDSATVRSSESRTATEVAEGVSKQLKVKPDYLAIYPNSGKCSGQVMLVLEQGDERDTSDELFQAVANFLEGVK